MKCPIEPLGDKVVILPQDEGEQMYGNIIVPDAGKEKPEIGTVMAVGEGRVTNEGAIIRNQLEVGQKVIVPKFGAQIVVVENETYIIASENDILGIIKNKENE
jgi:chaperonin GroES